MSRAAGWSALVGLLVVGGLSAAYAPGAPVVDWRPVLDQPQPTLEQWQVANASYAAEQRRVAKMRADDDSVSQAIRIKAACDFGVSDPLGCLQFYQRLRPMCAVTHSNACKVFGL